MHLEAVRLRRHLAIDEAVECQLELRVGLDDHISHVLDRYLLLNEVEGARGVGVVV